MEEDNTAMVSPTATSIIPETVPELEGKIEQSLATPTITNKKVAGIIALTAMVIEKMKLKWMALS
eukprot:8957307-Ditylum_brightwellii.AAC.1